MLRAAHLSFNDSTHPQLIPELLKPLLQPRQPHFPPLPFPGSIRAEHYWVQTGQGHNVRAWAELLILERATHPDTAMAYDANFGEEVQANDQRIGQRLSGNLSCPRSPV